MEPTVRNPHRLDPLAGKEGVDMVDQILDSRIGTLIKHTSHQLAHSSITSRIQHRGGLPSHQVIHNIEARRMNENFDLAGP